jgi:multidrug resistance efflux pump
MSKHLFSLVWLLALIAAAWGYYRWQVDPELVGIVESKFHPIGAREDGRIAKLTVQVGSRVTKDQLIASLDTSDLEAERAQLESELKTLQNLIEADRTRFGLEYDRLLLQLEHDSTYMDEKWSLMQSWRAELASLEREIERLQKAENSGLGRSRDLADMLIRRDALRSLINGQSVGTGNRRSRQKSATSRNTVNNPEDRSQVIESMLADRLERMNEILLELSINASRIQARMVVAPCDGQVVDVLYRLGDTVPAYLPILNVEESPSEYLEIYLPELSQITAELGDGVEIYSKRNQVYDTDGTVVFIHPGFSPVPERLWFRGQVYWARKVRVRLAAGHLLLPGESVRVKLVGPRESAEKVEELLQVEAKQVGDSVVPLAFAESDKIRDVADSSIDNKNEPADEVKRKTIQIPASLDVRTPIEASGVVWLDDLGRYLVISDDTAKKSSGGHPPWLFLMAPDGVVDAEPVVLAGVKTVNDLEAIVPISNTRFILVSSNSVSKKGKRPVSRQYLMDVERTGRQFRVVRKVKLFEQLAKSLTDKELAAVGLNERIAGGQILLNIEGAAYQEGALLLGLKQPVTEKGALILKLDNLDIFLSTGKLTPGQLSIWGRVKLGCFDEQCAGISDLLIDSQGRMLALSTIPNVPNSKQQASLHLIARDANGTLQATLLKRFESVKPEAICERQPGQYLIMFDRDDDPAQFVEWEWLQ